MRPLAIDPPETRADVQQAARDLFEPLAAHWSPGRARIVPGSTRATFPEAATGLEGFARPLWMLAPVTAGGGDFGYWAAYRDGLVHGTDPDHREFWGPITDRNRQAAVETAPIGVALALVPDRLWEPLDPAQQDRVAAWLRGVNDLDLGPSNWLFFRILANCGLAAVGAAHDAEQVERDLEVLDGLYRGNGWYHERDYYTAWEYHVDGLLYARLAPDACRFPEYVAAFRDRATAYIPEFAAWFAPDGAALPYGRSLTYRFAQGAFWGALGLGHVDPTEAGLTWGHVRGLWERQFAYWVAMPVTRDGILSVGYTYPTERVADVYNSPASPYWACKWFLPLALSDDHPFWQAEPKPLPDVDAVQPQPEGGLVLCRDDDHVFGLAAGAYHGGPKYAKFAYSTDYGFTVPTGETSPAGAGPDSTLLLTDEGTDYRARESTEATMTDDTIHSRWEPWPDVTLETWLVPSLPWHVRLHVLETGRELEAIEGGFALPRRNDHDPTTYEETGGPGSATACYPDGVSTIRVPERAEDERDGDVIAPTPNANLVHPRPVVPVLSGTTPPGTHWFVCSVYAGEESVPEEPAIERDGSTWHVGSRRIER